jgi:regulator of replication initiation timing
MPEVYDGKWLKEKVKELEETLQFIVKQLKDIRDTNITRIIEKNKFNDSETDHSDTEVV